MRRLVTPIQIYPALKALLGLPEHCVSFELSARAGELVTVICKHYVALDKSGIKQLESVFSQYDLVHRPAPASDETADPGAGFHVLDFDAWMRDRTERAHAEYMARHAAGGIAYGAP